MVIFMKESPLLGYYNVSVILTYIGLAAAVAGIFAACGGHGIFAVGCLLFSGICDMFDGKIARMTKRSEDAKVFGIQIDSLCDLVSFGVLPAVICYNIFMDTIVGTIVLILFVLAAVIRLAYFNVTEQKRQQETTENRKYYQGLPVTSIALLLPVVYLIAEQFYDICGIIMTIFMFAVAVLFVGNFRIRKPGKTASIVMVAVGLAIVVCYFIFGR